MAGSLGLAGVERIKLQGATPPGVIACSLSRREHSVQRPRFSPPHPPLGFQTGSMLKKGAWRRGRNQQQPYADDCSPLITRAFGTPRSPRASWSFNSTGGWRPSIWATAIPPARRHHDSGGFTGTAAWTSPEEASAFIARGARVVVWSGFRLIRRGRDVSPHAVPGTYRGLPRYNTLASALAARLPQDMDTSPALQMNKSSVLKRTLGIWRGASSFKTEQPAFGWLPVSPLAFRRRLRGIPPGGGRHPARHCSFCTQRLPARRSFGDDHRDSPVEGTHSSGLFFYGVRRSSSTWASKSTGTSRPQLLFQILHGATARSHFGTSSADSIRVCHHPCGVRFSWRPH